MELKQKKAILITTDAMIAFIIIAAAVLILIPITSDMQRKTTIEYDVLETLTSLKVGETNNSYVQSLIATGQIQDTNKTLLEQIGELYVTNKTQAEELASAVLIEVRANDNIGIWYGSTLIFAKNKTSYESATHVEVAKRIISGLKEGNSVTGYAARAFLANAVQTKYEYFGGYIGDGNITKKIYYNGNITQAEIELAINNNFTLSINNNSIGQFNKSSSEFTPVKYNISTQYFLSNIENAIEIKGNNLHIAGGYIKINYQSNPSFNQTTRYYLPGIDGLINIYDGMYIPTELSTMKIILHYNISQTPIFLTIGNTTVYNASSPGEKNITLNDTTLKALLSYAYLSKKTVPLRLGIQNVSYTSNVSTKVDIFSVTDISDSMAGTPLANAKSANNLLIDILLNFSSVRIGLVGYGTTAGANNYHDLSNDKTSLKNKVASWQTAGSTCICCGINRAIQKFTESMGISSKKKSTLVAYYAFNNSAGDSSGNNQNGTAFGSPTYSAGVYQSAISLNGAGQYIQVPTNESLNFGTESFTLAGWIYLNSLSAGKIILDKTTLTSGYMLIISDTNATQLKLAGGLFSARGTAQSNTGVLNTGAWQHIAAVVNTSSGTSVITFYVNGVNQGSGSISGLDASSTANLMIGHKSSIASSYGDFAGKMDDVRIYSEALTLTQIQSLANQTPICGNTQIEGGELCDANQQSCSLGGVLGTQTCNAGCLGFTTCNISYNCGNSIVNQNETCDDGNNVDNDGCSALCQLEADYRSMIVMSDGEANVKCAEQGTSNAKQDAIKAACQAWQNYGIKVNAVGFGVDADEATLQSIALCGNGSYYYANVNELAQIYQQIANAIIAQYVEQTVYVAGNNVYSQLFPDSYIEFTYNATTPPYGLVIQQEYPFTNNYSGQALIPADAHALELKVSSYSGQRWTDRVVINTTSLYQLSNFGANYLTLGDPYIIYGDPAQVTPGITQTVNVTTGSSPQNSSQGSIANKIFITFSRNITSFSPILANAQGCFWTVQFTDGTNTTLPIPSNYTGSDQCWYTAQNGTHIADTNDATQQAILQLLQKIDTDNDHKIDIYFESQALQIATTQVTGIPFTWSTEVQARTWR